MDDSEYEKFLNSEEFKKLDEHSKRLIKNMFESNLDLVKDFKGVFSKNGGVFIQDLNDDNFNFNIDSLIKEYEMSQEINISYNEDFGEEVISETWTSNDNNIKLKRFYEITYENINLLRPDSRKLVYQILLDRALIKEDYEKAAEIRDSIYLNE